MVRFEFGVARRRSAVTQQWSEIGSETTTFSTMSGRFVSSRSSVLKDVMSSEKRVGVATHCVMPCSSKTFRKWVPAVLNGPVFHCGCLALKSPIRKVGELVACSSRSERRGKKVRGGLGTCTFAKPLLRLPHVPALALLCLPVGRHSFGKRNGRLVLYTARTSPAGYAKRTASFALLIGRSVFRPSHGTRSVGGHGLGPTRL